VEAVDNNVSTFDSFMILRHGKVIAEGWWKRNSADKAHIMNSVSNELQLGRSRTGNPEAQAEAR
jgi:hypothetical protein